MLGPQGRTAREPLVAAVAVVEGLSPGERVLKESVGLLKDGAFVRLVEQVEQVEQVKQVDQADAAASAKPAMLGTAR